MKRRDLKTTFGFFIVFVFLIALANRLSLEFFLQTTRIPSLRGTFFLYSPAKVATPVEACVPRHLGCGQHPTAISLCTLLIALSYIFNQAISKGEENNNHKELRR